MREPRDRGERTHLRIWELLPWYVNGTLPPAERSTVEEHLAACPRCQEEERSCRALEAGVRGAEEIAPSPHPVRLARLLASIDDLETRAGAKPPAWRRVVGAIAAVAAFAGRPLRALFPTPARGMAAAQLAVLLLIAGLVGWQQWRARQPVYRTLSSPTQESLASGGLRIRVLFAEEATEREIRELLLGVRGEIVAGPSPFGVYTVEVPKAGDPLDSVLTHLRAQARVRLAEPAR